MDLQRNGKGNGNGNVVDDGIYQTKNKQILCTHKIINKKIISSSIGSYIFNIYQTVYKAFYCLPKYKNFKTNRKENREKETETRNFLFVFANLKMRHR